MSIVIAILIFCVIIIVHEIGHFSAARIFGMRVYSFSLGMGPTLWKKRRGDTDFCVKAIPFGGSVMVGEDDEETENDPDSFRNKPVWQRMIFILGGAFMNMVLGLVICLVIVLMNKQVDTTTIGSFYSVSVSNSQLQVGDKITNMNGMTIFTQADINYQLFHKEPRLAAGSSWDTPDMVAEDSRGADVNLVKTAYNFTVIRNGQKLHLENVPLYAVVMDDGSREIYLDFVNAREDKTFVNVIVRAGKETASLSRLIIITLVDLIRGTYGLNEISGPVGVVNAIGEVSQTGFERGVEAGGFWTGIKEGLRMCLFMAALITINVGIFNLLPVPALDGARFLFLGVEAVRRKPVKAEVEGMIHFVGFAALMLFMLVITVFDIRGLFQ